MTAIHEYGTPECDALIAEVDRLLDEIWEHRKAQGCDEPVYGLGFDRQSGTVRFRLGRPSAPQFFDTAEDLLDSVRRMHTVEMGETAAD